MRQALLAGELRGPAIDRIVRMAARSVGVPVAQVNLVTDTRQISASSSGPGRWATRSEVTLEESYCKYTLESARPLLIGDAREHPLVQDSPATTQSGIVAYAGVPLVAADDLVLGTLCVVSFEPREWSTEDVETLTYFADQVLEEFERRGHAADDLHHLLSVFESTDDAVVRVDAEGRIIQWNPGAERLFRYLPAEALGRSLSILTPGEGGGGVAEPLQRLLGGEVVRGEAQRLRSDGSEVTVSYVATPVRDLAGRVIGATKVMRDISGRTEAERALRQSEARFRSLVENVAEIITILDRTGTILYESPAIQALLGYTPDELVGHDVMEFVHPDDLATIHGRFAESLRRPGVQVAYRFRFRHKNGSWRILEGCGTNLADDPAVGGIVANSRDVTDRERLEEQLRGSQRMEAVGRLAGGVAHDFNNLLMVIDSCAQFMISDLPEAHPSRADALEIRSSAKRAATLTHQLLAFSRRQVLQPKVVDLNEIVGETESMLRRLVGEDLALITQLGPSPMLVHVDPGQMVQVLMNLVINARDAMPRGGRILIGTRNDLLGARAPHVLPNLPADMPAVVLSVSDTGSGIPRELQDRVFEPFFSTKGDQGTGLGLSTVYGIVKQSQGYIWLDSEEGVGTTFQIRLPRAELTPDLADAPALRSPAAAVGTILLVEDDASVRMTIERLLRLGRYEVLTPETPEEALRMARGAARIDLLLTDLVMPAMSGRELSERMRELRPGIQVLFMSGYTDDALVRQGVHENTENFISKPFDADAILRRVGDLLGAPEEADRD